MTAYPEMQAGEANYIRCLISELRAQTPTLAINVLTFRGAASPTDLGAGINVTRSLVGSGIGKHFNWIRIARAVIRTRPAILHSNASHTRRFGGLFGELSILGFALARMLGVKHLTTIHSVWPRASFLESFAGRFPRVVSLVLWQYYRWSLQALTASAEVSSFVVSAKGANALAQIKAEIGVRKGVRPEAHPCSFRARDPAKCLEARRYFGLSPNSIVFSAYGFIRVDKGYDRFVAAAEKLMACTIMCEFVLAGRIDHSCSKTYVSELARLSRRSAKFKFSPQYLSDGEMEMLLMASDVLVIPYRIAFGASGPIHHALGSGVAVLAADTGYNRDLKGICELFDNDSQEALYLAMSELAAVPAKRHRLVDSATLYAAQNTWAHLARQYAALYGADKALR